MESKQFLSGHVNHVYLMNGYVVKEYCNDHLMPKPSPYRLKREKSALKRFGGIIAPRLIKECRNKLFLEFIEGPLLEELAGDGSIPFYCRQAGALLQTIHEKIELSIDCFRERIEKQIKKDKVILAGLLQIENINPEIQIKWEIVKKAGITRVHRDFHLGNIIKGKQGLRVIDWESFGVGSPYEDFAFVELWIFRQYGHKNEFFKGYGKDLDHQTIQAFLKAKSFQNLARLVSHSYTPTPLSEFYYHKFIEVLKDL